MDSNKKGKVNKEWIPDEKIKVQYYDRIIPGYKNDETNMLRLWHWENNDKSDYLQKCPEF
jgi:Carbohydrate phosphorylase